MSRNITASVTDEDGTFTEANLVVGDFWSSRARELDGVTGDAVQVVPTDPSVSGHADAIVGPDGYLYVSGYNSNSVVRFDLDTSSFVDAFVPSSTGGLSRAAGLAFDGDGNLYVASYETDSVKRYEAGTGTYLGDFVASGVGGIDAPLGLTFGPDGDLYVASWLSSNVVRFAGDTGAPLGEFASTSSMTTDLEFGPNGNLFVGNRNNGRVDEYDGTTGAAVGVFANLAQTFGLTWGPDGNLYVGSEIGDLINVYNQAGTLLRTHSDTGDGLGGPWLMTFTPDHQVAVTATVVVNSTGDGADATPGDSSCDTGGLNAEGDAECTLRAAIEEANSPSNIRGILFDIPAADGGHSGGVWTIAPAAPLDPITSGITIDATTQPGYVAGTNAAPAGLDGMHVVFLDGASAGATSGLTLAGDGIRVAGLAVGGFTGHGIHITGNDNTVNSAFIGTNATGTAAVPNGDEGIHISGDRATIGGTNAKDRVLVSGNGNQGIDVSGADAEIYGAIVGLNAAATAPIPNGANGIRLSGSTGATIGAAGAGNIVAGNNLAPATADGIYVTGGGSHIIQSNLIGTNDAGASLGNYYAGIAISNATGVRVGGTTAPRANVILTNGGPGVVVSGAAAADNAILGNTMHANGELGIDLGGGGVTLNDAGDSDPGPNDLLNFPVITSATESGGTVTVDFDLDVPAGDYRVEVFTNPSGTDPSGYGEGEQFENGTTITHTGGGAETFQVTYPGNIGDVVTVTATEQAVGPVYGSTSEFSVAVSVVAANSLPTAVLGGPYVLVEGGDLVLDGSGSTDPDGDGLSYAWDLDGDLVFDDATGVNPTVPWLTLVGLGVDDDGVFPVGLQVDDAVSGTHEVTGTFTVSNTAPTLTVTGAATTTAGALYTLTLGVSDPGADTVSGWVVNWGDGTVDTIAGNPGSVTHRYANEGFTNAVTVAAVDEDGTWHQNRLLVTSTGSDALLRYEATSGGFVDAVGAAGDGLSGPRPVTIGPDGAAYIASATTADIRRFDPIAGGYLSTFVTAGAGGLSTPSAMAFGPDGFLYVADATDNDIVRFDGATGAFDATFVASGAGGLTTPEGLAFGPGDDLFVSSAGSDEVLRFDGTTGAFIETFISTAGGLDDPRGLVFGPGGDLHVASFATSEVRRFDGATGAFELASTTGAGLVAPVDVTIGPDGDLYVADLTNAAVYAYDPATGTPHGTHVSAGAGGLSNPRSLTFAPEHQVRTLPGGAPPGPPDIVDASIRRSDLAAAGGASVAGTPAVAGNGQTFTGGTQRLTGPAIDITTGSLTMTGWVNPNPSAVDQRLIAKTSTEGTTIYELLIDGATNEAVARIHTGATTVETRGGTVTTGTWHHLAAVWNGTTLTLHVDGTPVDTTAATGALSTDPNLPVTIANIASADRGLDGTLDHITINHQALSAAEIATTHTIGADPAGALTIGAQQTGTANPWTVTSTQTRSGSYSLQAPTAAPGTDAWATATGINEPGLEVHTWWWYSTDTAIDIATGLRTGTTPTNQWETSLTSPSGWDLARHNNGTPTQDAPPAGTPTPNTWTKVTIRTDENGDTSVHINDTQIIAPTNQGTTPTSGSIGLRASTLPGSDNWHIDDIRARKLTSTEPTTTLGPLDRN